MSRNLLFLVVLIIIYKEGGDVLLQAMTEKGESIIPALFSKTQLEQLKTQHTFWCPSCKQEVVLKIGQQIMPHFAHKQLQQCVLQKGEGTYHETGKILLYQWLKSQGLEVYLEKWMPSIKRTPDLTIKLGGKEIVLEYQCARIDIKTLQTRMNDYKQANLAQLWILGGNRLKRKQNGDLILDEFTKQCIHHFKDYAPQLYYFCSIQKQFIVYPHILPAMHHQNSTLPVIRSLRSFTFIELLNQAKLSIHAQFSLWNRKKYMFRTRPSRKLFGAELTYRTWLYEQNLHIEKLPSLIYLPISTQYKMKTNPWNWQSRIIISLFLHKPKYTLFTLKQCHLLLKTHFVKHLSPIHLDQTSPVEEYLMLLERLGYVKRKAKNQFQILKRIEMYQNVEESVKGDTIWLKNALQQLNLKEKAKHEHGRSKIRYTKTID